jgi:hypothetical protein
MPCWVPVPVLAFGRSGAGGRLNAQRASFHATDENVPQVLSGCLLQAERYGPRRLQLRKTLARSIFPLDGVLVSTQFGQNFTPGRWAPLAAKRRMTECEPRTTPARRKAG